MELKRIFAEAAKWEAINLVSRCAACEKTPNEKKAFLGTGNRLSFFNLRTEKQREAFASFPRPLTCSRSSTDPIRGANLVAERHLWTSPNYTNTGFSW